MRKRRIGFTLTAKCINNKGYEMEFVVGDSYQACIGQMNVLGVIGRDNEAYVYPSKLFEVRDVVNGRALLSGWFGILRLKS